MGRRLPNETIADFLLITGLLTEFDEKTGEQVNGELRKLTLPAGQILFHQGDDAGDGMYVVLKGKLQAVVATPDGQPLILGEATEGQTVGEMALLTGQERSATVIAAEDSELVQVSREAFARLTEQNSPVVAQMARTILRRLRRNQLTRLLQEKFGELDEMALHDLRREIEWVELTPGEVLFRQGDKSTDLYFVSAGRLSVVVEDVQGAEREVGELTRGDSVGEMALLTNDPRSASVYATRDTELVKFSQATFNRLLEKHPHAMMQIARTIVQRFRTTLEGARRESHLATLVIVPLSEGVPIADFAQRLTETLSKHVTAALLTANHFKQFLEQEGIARIANQDLKQYKMIAWLNEYELSHAYVVYQADMGLTDWSRQCLRQADHVLLVGDPRSGQTLTEFEEELERLRVMRQDIRTSLVLLYTSPAQSPANTIAWLNYRHLHRHYHVRLYRPEDFERLGRFLVGKAVGLALSGGGARGFAHIGVMRAMQELGIPIDLIGGTSMGSVIAAEYALGWSLDTMIERNASIKSVLGDYTLPYVSLLTGKKMAQLFKRFFGDANIEDLWLEYFCVSTNLTRAEIALHTCGPLWRGIRASSTLAGLMPPVVLDGDLHVDGALLDNLPMDVMRQRVASGRVVAVDVSPPVDLAKNPPIGDGLSGWSVVYSRISPFGQRIKIPNIAAILQRAFEVGSLHDQKSLIRGKYADVYLQPPLEQFDLFQGEAIREIVEIGYRFALEKLAAWQERERQ